MNSNRWLESDQYETACYQHHKQKLQDNHWRFWTRRVYRRDSRLAIATLTMRHWALFDKYAKGNHPLLAQKLQDARLH